MAHFLFWYHILSRTLLVPHLVLHKSCSGTTSRPTPGVKGETTTNTQTEAVSHLLFCTTSCPTPGVKGETTTNTQTEAVSHLLFWYHVLTCVSLSPSLAASSRRSWTLRYFCRSKLRSRQRSCWSLNAVLALRGFLHRSNTSGGGCNLLAAVEAERGREREDRVS